MASQGFTLEPLPPLRREGKRWHPGGAVPWFRLTGPVPAGGCWVRLRWKAGLADAVNRPMLRYLDHEGRATERVLPAAPFGQQSWIGFVPEATVECQLSPCSDTADFGFELMECRVLTQAEVLLRLMRQNPGRALWALGAWLVRRNEDCRLLIQEELGGAPVGRYAAHRIALSRRFEAEGLDGLAMPPDSPPLLLILSGWEGEAAMLAGWLRELEAQPFRNWRVLLPAPQSERARKTLESIPFRHHPQLDVIAMPAGLPSALTTLPAEAWVAVLPISGRLARHALTAVSVAALRSPHSDVIYADEEEIGASPLAIKPWIKPGFDPGLIGRVPLCGRASFWHVGRTCLLLAGKVHIEAFRGLGLGRPLFSDEAALPVEGAMEQSLRAAGCPRPDLMTMATPKAAVIIPNKDRVDLLRPCVTSLLATAHGEIDIVIVDNGSSEPESLAYLDAVQANPAVRVIRRPGPFNFSALCNSGVAASSAPLLVFLNNDTQVISADWLERLARFAVLPEVGAVGAKLLYADGRVQHGGIVMGLGGRADHFDIGLGADDPGFFHRANLPHAVSAVTGACLAVERTKFEAVGGFDEANLPVDLNDIDLCLRLGEAGLTNVMAADCRFYHYESATRGRLGGNHVRYAREREYFLSRWSSILRDDPHFSPALSLLGTAPRLA